MSIADLREQDFVIYRSEEPKAMHDHVSAIAAKGFSLRAAQVKRN
jgi:hypothetical protein